MLWDFRHQARSKMSVRRLGLMNLTCRRIRVSRSLSVSEVRSRRSRVKRVEKSCDRMNQAMKLGTPNEMRGDSITAWHAGRQGVHFLEQMGADEFLNEEKEVP